MRAKPESVQSQSSQHLSASPGHVVVEINEVSKSFPVAGRRVPVIGSVSLTVRAGEMVSVVGPSGCGKTTLLRMIQGLERPSSGSITIEGKPPRSGDVNAGFVFQQPALFPWFNLEKNIGFGLRLRTSARSLASADQSARVAELIDLVGLSGYAQYRPHELSGGMRQRANLARALAVDPAVLLLDEPFSAVDTLTRERLQRALADLLGNLGTAAILVTHDIREAVFLGSRVVVMAPGPGRIISEHQIGVPFPRTEEFQHGSQLAELAQSIYSDLRQIDEAQASHLKDDQIATKDPGRLSSNFTQEMTASYKSEIERSSLEIEDLVTAESPTAVFARNGE